MNRGVSHRENGEGGSYRIIREFSVLGEYGGADFDPGSGTTSTLEAVVAIVCEGVSMPSGIGGGCLPDCEVSPLGLSWM